VATHEEIREEFSTLNCSLLLCPSGRCMEEGSGPLGRIDGCDPSIAVCILHYVLTMRTCMEEHSPPGVLSCRDAWAFLFCRPDLKAPVQQALTTYLFHLPSMAASTVQFYLDLFPFYQNVHDSSHLFPWQKSLPFR